MAGMAGREAFRQQAVVVEGQLDRERNQALEALAQTDLPSLQPTSKQ
jgi:hypothetical protein